MNLRPLLLLALLPGAALAAQVTLPRILASHMVVQRDLPVHVWGMAAPGEAISVSFRGETRSTTAGPLGRWSIYLSPGAAGGPFELTVTGSPAAADNEAASPAADTIKLDDVLVGDVWVASGQSNMEFAMRQAATADADLPHAGNRNIRLLIVKKKAIESRQDDVELDAGWAASTPETAKDFSAVAWYFAREIESREHVPVGVIDSTWGGHRGRGLDTHGRAGRGCGPCAAVRFMGQDDRAGSGCATRGEKDQQRQRDEAKAQGKPDPQFPWHPQLTSWGPAMLYNGMIAPLTPFPIRGVIWYQGESNSALVRAPLYNRIFRTHD